MPDSRYPPDWMERPNRSNNDLRYTVHAPASWSKLRRLLKKNAERPGFIARYEAACGATAELPPRAEIRTDEEGSYFLCGPHERYYQRCEACG